MKTGKTCVMGLVVSDLADRWVKVDVFMSVVGHATDQGFSLSGVVLAIDNPFSVKSVLLVMQNQ